MLENFQLAAIVRQAGQSRLLRIPLHQALQDELAESWAAQYRTFTNDVDEIDFNAGYMPEAHERFRLSDYQPPDWLSGEDSRSAGDLDPITNDDALLDATKGLAAFARENGEEVILFQNFNRSHVIRPGHFLFLKNNTYETTVRPGLTLDTKLSAVYLHVDRKLLFHNFRTVNTFLPLENFFEDASAEQIREVLNHESLTAEDVDALAVDSNQWFRKRFAMLRKSGMLDRFTPDQIQQRSRGYDVNIRTRDGKIVFPAEKAAAKK